MAQISRTLLTTLVFGFLSGLVIACSSTNSPKLSRSDLALLEREFEMDIFSARGFLGGSEYERYHLENGSLWRECGDVNISLNKSPGRLRGDDVLKKDPSLQIRERRMEKLDAEKLLEIKKRALRFSKIRAEDPRRYPLPGSVFSLAEPGLLEISLQIDKEKHRFVTSVDAIAEEESVEDSLLLAEVLQLIEAIRGVGPVICNSKTFFGIGRRNG